MCPAVTSSSRRGARRGFRRSASITTSASDGISLLLIVLTGFLTADRAAVVVGRDRAQGQGILDLHAGGSKPP
jgi:hypothetical protein